MRKNIRILEQAFFKISVVDIRVGLLYNIENPTVRWLMKIGLFSEAFDLKEQPFDIKLLRIGNNSGNLAFFRALKKLFNPLFINPNVTEESFEERYASVDKFITTELIWIGQNSVFESLRRKLDLIKDKPLIPISVGLQNGECSLDFKMHHDTVKLIQEISERCTVGVRGEYTAGVLEKYGIKNVSVIGCPSVFYKNKYSFKKPKDFDNIKTCANFITLYKELSEKENSVLSYFRDMGTGFAEQTALYDISNHKEYDEWLTCEKRFFFDIYDWDKYLSDYEFSLGMRFHGNIIAMQNKMRALVITSDSRTGELTEYFKIPHISIRDFDTSKSMSYYYEKADPELFLKNYPALKRNMIDFARSNGLPINLK